MILARWGDGLSVRNHTWVMANLGDNDTTHLTGDPPRGRDIRYVDSDITLIV